MIIPKRFLFYKKNNTSFNKCYPDEISLLFSNICYRIWSMEYYFSKITEIIHFSHLCCSEYLIWRKRKALEILKNTEILDCIASWLSEKVKIVSSDNLSQTIFRPIKEISQSRSFIENLIAVFFLFFFSISLCY